MNKKDLRLKYKLLRKNLSVAEMEELSLAIANKLLILPIWDRKYYHVFLPIVELKEVNTEYILHILSGKDKEIVVSKSNFDTLTMKHYLLTDATEIVKNEHHIPEPKDGIEVPVNKIDVVFVPLMAFDIQGNRIGYGKGFYDTFLAQCQPDTIKIGLSFFNAEESISDVFENDVNLNYCITGHETHIF